MDIEALTAFFMWTTIINGSLLVLWATTCVLAPERVYRTQSRWFPIARETYNVVIYSFLGLFKIFFLVFSAVPYVALLLLR